MIPAPVEYTRARTLEEALEAAGARGTKVLAGGQTLVPLLRFRLARPKRVVDIAHVPQLRGIRRSEYGVVIGAATTYRELLDAKSLRRSHPIIAETVEHIGDRQVRNIATIGGGLAHADPASDMPAVMLALNAQFTLQSMRGTRTVPAHRFFRGPFTTALKKSELLTGILLPALPERAGTAYVSFEQAASGYALVGAAAVLTLAARQITNAALAITGLADTPFLANAGSLLIGQPAGDASFEAAARAAVDGVVPNDDFHASGDYRLHLATVAVHRALALAAARTRRS